MRKISLILCLLLVLSVFAGCKKNSADDVTTTTEKSQQIVTTTKTDISETVTSSEIQSTTSEKTTGKKEDAVSKENTSESETQSITETTTMSVLEKLENSEVVTYYSENPNNKYICVVAEKYGADKSTLVALIRTKAQNPGATVLQFSGKTDENGELIKTKNELKYVYEVNDSDNTIKRAAEISSENDGYSASESRTIFMLTKQFIVPELEKLKEEHTYPE